MGDSISFRATRMVYGDDNQPKGFEVYTYDSDQDLITVFNVDRDGTLTGSYDSDSLYPSESLGITINPVNDAPVGTFEEELTFYEEVSSIGLLREVEIFEQEARIGSDLNDDGIIGPYSSLLHLTSGMQLTEINHIITRNTNAYNTTQGLILDPYHDGTFDDDFSRTSLDLRNDLVLLKDQTGSTFSLPSEQVLVATQKQNYSPRVKQSSWRRIRGLLQE